ncbi:NAD(P)-binding domain-containing protein [Ruania zhangjianzhongii]|uniref:NAD(P)-binding domain-containing protein n=1 Tax=Ruania zhangjianzhongii TaxID=2603206 RepID=UPI0011CBACC7|nr:NAD(P)-binding domain-containing protein [Ruania zhangjianzhongii]
MERSSGTEAATFEVVVIGAGQAGLAAARTLVQAGLRPGIDLLVLDAGDGPGGSWRHRWDSLTLGRAHGIADLPGLPLGPVDSERPASQVVADYYGRYEDEHELQVRRPAQVTEVHSGPRPDQLTVHYESEGTPSSITTGVLLNATGTWTRPYVPYVPGIETFTGKQLHTTGFRAAEDFTGLRTLVVGGGLSAVQFLLQLAPVTETVWATRRPPNFTDRAFDPRWGLDVENAVRERTRAGRPPASVVRTTGIPLLPEYVAGAESGVLVSRGMITRIHPEGVHFPGQSAAAGDGAEGLGPSASGELVVPQSWQPFEAPVDLDLDVIFWNTGFRAALDHLAPLRLRERGGGIRMRSEVEVAADERVLLVGYGSSASTIGATRAGRAAGRAALRRLGRTRSAQP